MNVVFIGKGMCRIIVRSKAKLERLKRIPDVHVEGSRVIFPEWLLGNIKLIVNPRPPRRGKIHTQTDMFPDDS